jgi:ATP-binding cassette subfamily B protein
MDCGPASLRIVAAYYGRNLPQSMLRERCHITREGVSMLGISDAAESIGFRTIGVKITFEQLSEVTLPCIVHWNQRHFVVVYDIKKRRDGDYRISISDPASGLLKYDLKGFMKCWGVAESEEGEKIGTALLLEPTPHFYEELGGGKAPKSFVLNFRFLFKYVTPYRKYVVQLVLAMITGSIIGLIMPFLTQSIVDTGIGNNDLNFIVVILIAQLMLTLGSMANNLIRSWLMLHVTTRVSISLISDFLSKLMRLPIAFFDSKNVGDIMQRIGDHGRIQSFLTGSLISIAVSALTFVIYGGVMMAYDLGILGVFLLGSILYIGWILLFLRRRRKLDYMRFQESSTNQSNLVQLINGMQDIKLNNCEKQKRWEWERIQVKLYNVSVKGLTLSQTQQIGGTFIDQAKNITISFMAASTVVSGDMTLGMMMAMQYIIGQLNGPIGQFISFVQEAQDAKISLERLSEIHQRPDEEPTEQPKIRTIPNDADLELKNVMFQYEGPHSEKVLDGINLRIPSDKVTAIVGASGSGKTTLLKLLLGFYSPVEGQVLLAGKPLEKYSDSRWRAHCGVVMQEGYIFSDTIANNIAVSEEDPDRKRLRQSVEIANIGEFIDSLPLGYHTRIGADGHGLSTGQKQRLLIARAAYKEAPYLLFDEATNALDANNEKVIMENLSRLFRGKTVIIVAHRLSTVKDADNIVVLNKGKIVEEGTHSQLVARKGYYYELVRNQLELGS